MPTSDAMKRALKKYEQKHDKISLRMPKGKKEEIAAFVQASPNPNDESVNKFIMRAIDETMERETNEREKK